MEGKRTLKFNLFDVAIIVLVLAVLAGALMLRNRSAGGAAAGGQETHTMRFTVEFTEVPHAMVESIRIGDGAYRAVDGLYLGTIVDVKTAPHAKVEYSSVAERFVAYGCEESDDLYLTVENQGYCTGKDIVIGDLAVKVGAELPVKGRGFARSGYVYDVDPMGAPVSESTDAQTGEREAEFVICFVDSRSFVVENIHVGDRFYEKSLGALIGEVQSVETVPYGETQLRADGTAAFAEKTGRSNILVTLKGRYTPKDDSYYLDGVTELKIGGAVKIVSNYIDREGVYYELISLGE